MSGGVLERRVAKLEEQAFLKPRLTIHCIIVEEGHEDENVAAYFAERGIVPDPDMLRVRIGRHDGPADLDAAL